MNMRELKRPLKHRWGDKFSRTVEYEFKKR